MLYVGTVLFTRLACRPTFTSRMLQYVYLSRSNGRGVMRKATAKQIYSFSYRLKSLDLKHVQPVNNHHGLDQIAFQVDVPGSSQARVSPLEVVAELENLMRNPRSG